MERLDVIVARVLAGVSVAIEEESAGARTRDLSRPGSGPRDRGEAGREEVRGGKGEVRGDHRAASRKTIQASSRARKCGHLRRSGKGDHSRPSAREGHK